MTTRPVEPDATIEVTTRQLNNGRFLVTALQFRLSRAGRTVVRSCGLQDFPENPNGFDSAYTATEAGLALGRRMLRDGEVC